MTVHKTVVRAREAGTSIVGEGLGKREKLENRDTVNSVNIDSRKMPKAPAKRMQNCHSTPFNIVVVEFNIHVCLPC